MHPIVPNRSSIVKHYNYPFKNTVHCPAEVPRRSVVTVAAGFLCRDGILLCADTQISAGSKYNESKIIKAVFGSEDPATSATVLVAICGAVKYARMGARHCFQAISKLKQNERTIETILECFEHELKSLFNEHLYPHPQYKDGAVSVQYLVGVQMANKIGLYSTSDTAIDPVEYDSLGSGSYLGGYLARPILQNLPSMDMRQTAFWAVHLLKQVKSYDLHTGGYSELQFLGKDGSVSRPGHFEIAVREEYLDKFDLASRNLFSKIMVDQKDFDKAVARFQVEMTKVRDAWEQRRDEYEHLFGVLTKKLK